MSDVPVIETVTENSFIAIQNEIYKVTQDRTDSTNPMDYELTNVNNRKDRLNISRIQLEQNLGSSWWIVDKEQIGEQSD